MSVVSIILVIIVAFFAGMEGILDEFQFHQPLVACTLIGLVTGNLEAGIILGGSLQMIALGWANIGAAVAPDAALASVASTIILVLAWSRRKWRIFRYRHCDSSGCSRIVLDDGRSYTRCSDRSYDGRSCRRRQLSAKLNGFKSGPLACKVCVSQFQLLYYCSSLQMLSRLVWNQCLFG